ncbi:MAG: glucose-6-phosphate isomerase [Opitutales bacterium]
MTWNRFQACYYSSEKLGFSLDISRMNFPADFLQKMENPVQECFEDMDALEKGSIANPDEDRMVGHYWLRSPERAPSEKIQKSIEQAVASIHSFVGKVHAGNVTGEGGPFTHLLLIGIGGSALGPQFVEQALGDPMADKMRIFYLDNTDPDGMDGIFARLEGHWSRTLILVISKSGGTPETRNGMIEARKRVEKAGLSFPRHAVAVTGVSSQLDRIAEEEEWLQRFPMWDWVGGRTSELGPVGLLPAALQGIDVAGMLKGAAAMDELTRSRIAKENPAALLALMWFYATEGKGKKDMVILPYKDRLQLFSRYLQQLVMESLGKERDLDGNIVNQGISVFGNKGSTDQHAYIQQLRDGVLNFFVTFIEVLKDREPPSVEVDPGITSGDYLNGFLLGTRHSLYEKNRESITITIKEVTPESVGMLIALYERAVGLYAGLIHINAYHQPGVEAGKKAASSILALQKEIVAKLRAEHSPLTVDDLARKLGRESEEELIFKLLEHLCANPERNIRKTAGPAPFSATYTASDA